MLVSASACPRGPDAEALEREVRQKLNDNFKSGLFEVASLKRQGSAQLPASEQGASRARRVLQPHAGAARGVRLQRLGSVESGDAGERAWRVREGRRRGRVPATHPGDTIRVYASSTYERSGDAWTPVAFTPAAIANAPSSDPGNAAPASQSRQFLDQLAAMVDIHAPRGPDDEDRIIAEELEHAVTEITRRRERDQHEFIVASGPRRRRVARVAEAIVTAVRGRRATSTSGHSRRPAASRTFSGWAGARPTTRWCRATSRRWPCRAPVPSTGWRHDEPCRRGQSLPGAGARRRVRQVADSARRRPERQASQRRASRTPAVVSMPSRSSRRIRSPSQILPRSASAPWMTRSSCFARAVWTRSSPREEPQSAAFRRLAGEHDIRFLSLDEDAIERIVSGNPGIVRLTLPAHTYPRQTEAVVTVAPTALLVGTTDAPEGRWRRSSGCSMRTSDFAGAGSAQATKISRSTALRGVSIPLHPGAAKYLGRVDK